MQNCLSIITTTHASTRARTRTHKVSGMLKSKNCFPVTKFSDVYLRRICIFNSFSNSEEKTNILLRNVKIIITYHPFESITVKLILTILTVYFFANLNNLSILSIPSTHPKIILINTEKVCRFR